MGDLVAYLSYPDAAEAIDWLGALGFEIAVRADDGDRVLHSELRRGSAVIMLATDDREYSIPPLMGVSTGVGCYLVVEPTEVDELHEAATSGGGRSVIAPEQTEWGGRRARVLDPAGREWTFGSYAPARA